MSSSSNIICPTCDNVLRPPFAMYSEGEDGLLCNNCCRRVDAPPATLVAFVNKVLRSPLDQCQYGCGLRANMVILAGHERTCSLRTECAFNWCQWVGAFSKLLPHVEFAHPARLVDLSSLGNTFMLQLDHPLLLLSHVDKDGDINNLYWVRLHKNEERMFIILSKQGRVIKRGREECLLKSYSLSSVTDPEFLLTAEVVFPQSDKDDIQDGRFVESRGTDITFLNANKFVIKVRKDGFKKTAATSSDWKCSACGKDISERIMVCVQGDFYCDPCCRMFAYKCPKCQQLIKHQGSTNLKNFPAMGCNSVSKETNQQENHHLVKCLNYIPDAICSWIGPYKYLVDHLKGMQHGLRVKAIRTPHLVSFGSQCSYFLYTYDRNYFLCTFKTYCHDTYAKISFCHISTKTDFDYEFSFKLVNENKKMVDIFGRPCKAHKMQWSITSMPASYFYSSLNKDHQFQMMVIISRKPS